VNSNWCNPVKNTTDWSAVVFCACKVIIQLLSVVLSVLRAAHKCRFTIINETRNKWQQVRRRSCSDKKKLLFVIGSVYLSPINVKGLYPRCADQLLSIGYGRVTEIVEREWTWIFTDNFNITYFLITCALFSEDVIVSDYLFYTPNTASLFTKTKHLTLLSEFHNFFKKIWETLQISGPQ
jgi:hypothetical protein